MTSDTNFPRSTIRGRFFGLSVVDETPQRGRRNGANAAGSHRPPGCLRVARHRTPIRPSAAVVASTWLRTREVQPLSNTDSSSTSTLDCTHIALRFIRRECRCRNSSVERPRSRAGSCIDRYRSLAMSLSTAYRRISRSRRMAEAASRKWAATSRSAVGCDPGWLTQFLERCPAEFNALCVHHSIRIANRSPRRIRANRDPER